MCENQAIASTTINTIKSIIISTSNSIIISAIISTIINTIISKIINTIMSVLLFISAIYYLIQLVSVFCNYLIHYQICCSSCLIFIVENCICHEYTNCDVP